MDAKEKGSDDDWAGKGASFEKLIKQYKDDPKVKRRSRTSTEESEEKTSNDVQKNLETDVPPGIRSAIDAAAQEELPVRRQGRRSANFGYGNGNELDVALGMQDNDNMDIKDEFKDEDDDPNAQQVKWNIKVTLRSHLDSIRAMQFHPVEPVLFTASEDGLIKLWNLDQKKDEKHNSGGTELEPVYTFRGHKGPVLCLVLSPTGDHLYTGGIDGNICCFNVPSSNGDPFDSYDPRVLTETLTGHTDAIWSVAYHSSNSRLVSASSDSTVRLWEPGNGEPLIRTIGAPKSGILPTSVDFVSTETSHLLAAYTNCYAQIIDIDTGSTVMVFDFGAVTGSPTMNKIVSHPTMPLTLIGGEDRTIRYFDNTNGSIIHEAIAHVEGVSSLAIDPNGLYLLSGSHDGSIRMWNMEKRSCLQEISAHRKKNDSAVTSVAFHPSRSLIGSAGADSLAKVYVSGSN